MNQQEEVGTESPSPKLITVSPQIHANRSTASIMWSVTAALIPAAAWGVYLLGPATLITLGVSIAAAVLTEYVIARLLGRYTLSDGSAVVTGLLIGMNLPTEVPFYIPIIASVFAIAVVKWTFGGLGANWMNPALAGRVVVFFSWTAQMTTWKMPAVLGGVDGVTGATVLGSVKSGLFNYTGNAAGPLALLNEIGYPRSTFDVRFTDGFNRAFHWLGIHLPPRYADLFFGNVPGSIGEMSAFLLLIGAAFLFARKIISWQVPVSYLGTFAVLVFLFGGLRFGHGIGAGNVVFHLFSGGLVLGVFFMATDMVTSPLTGRGMIIFGVGAGFLTFLIRFYGSFPEGVSLAIILMNIFVPMINRYTKSKRFGVATETEEKA